MVDTDTFRRLAASFDEVAEQPHFEKISFRVKKKIFATLDVGSRIAVLKLSEADQSVFCLYDKSIIYPVVGGWGRQGWTHVALDKIDEEMLIDALTCCYCHTAPKSLAERYRQA